MNNTLMTQLTEQMLNKKGITSMQHMNEVNEVDDVKPQPILLIKYENGIEEYIRGEQKIEAFINTIISSR